MLVAPDKAEEESIEREREREAERVVEDHIKYYRNRHILVSISDFLSTTSDNVHKKHINKV